MATKMKVLKLLQELRGLAEITNRHPQVRTPGPLLLPVRTAQNPARRRKTIRINVQDLPDIPHPVKITHLKAAAASVATLAAQ
jgi:hypothetical protein